MNLLDSILEYNRAFVDEDRFVPYLTNKLPNKKYVVISCMDTRLVELLPASMDIKNGDVILLKTGGAIVSHAFGSVMRSILVSVYELGAKEIFLVGHHDCGMGKVNSSVMIDNMKKNGITQDTLNTIEASGIDLKSWLRGFDSVEETVKNGVKIIRNHPLLANIPVHGLIMDPDTGRMDVVEAGYEAVVSS
ncbi:carbonic anhydrase [Ammoniphilus oxalaticus]|uniref:carbonic anhydrase n=1 Tax=Ammoniphilus oxalaticus TaxID=66863 RepID=A0A419SEL8_9BACL|nr:carbonic anhydrase [Ammoniphilus oxalaticus]RKD21775.1 carbonic anhydrase [Ammoniphilus oxalaticus]